MMKRLAILGVLAALATIGSAVPISGCKTTHRVSSGEKCSSIATIWKLTVTQLESINPSLNCNALQLHELVCVQATLPSTSSAAVSTSQGSSTCLEKYTVQKGDTCYNIAKNSSLTLAELQHLNPKVNCTILQIGAKLCVKSGPTTSSTTSTSTLTSTSTHTGSASTPTSFGCTKLVAVGEEDTCYSISVAAGISLTTFYAFNPAIDCSFLHLGMDVCVAQGKGGSPPPPIPIYTCTEPGKFAVSFDDGPYMYTDELLDYLEEQNLTVTFFINGQNYGNIYDYTAPLQRAFKSGHQIAHHTWSHANISTLSVAGLKSEISQLETAFRDIIGVIPSYFRPPFGEFLTESLIILGELGYKVIVWDVDTDDWQLDNLAKEQVNYKAGVAGTSPKTGGHISLQHDPHSITVKQLVPWAIPWIKSLGYEITTVADCLGDHNPKDWYRP